MGDWQSPQGELELKAQGLAWQTHRVAALSLKAKGDRQKLSAALQAAGFSDADKDSRVELQWQGSLAKHQLNLSTRAWGASLSSRLVGSLDDRWQWSGRLEQLRLIQADAGLWQQTTPTLLSAAQSSVRLQTPLCLQQLTSKLCLNQASWSPRQGTQLSVSLDEFYLSRFKPWLPKTLKLEGKAQATLTFSQLGQNRQGRLILSLPASQLSYTTLSGKQTFAYDKVSLIAQLTNLQLESQWTANFKHGVTLEGQSRHIIGQWQALDLQGKVNVDDLSIAQGLLPDITGLAGRMTSSFSLSGQVNRPQLTAQLQLSSVRLRPVVTGIEFTVPQLFLDIKPTGSVSIDGQLLAGEGRATLQGWGSVADWSQWSMDLLIQGQNLRIAKTPQADIWLSPNIQLSATPQQVDILGQLIVPKARLSVNSVGNKAIGLSDDVMIAGEETSNAKMKLVPHMRVLLGEGVTLSGSGLTTGLMGQLEITRSRLGNLLFQGEVNTKNGQFKAYQQDLTIEHGSLLFNGVSDNPGLNVVASRKVLDETVGVTVTGSLAKPRLTVFSRPTMPDTDALSLLVLGKKSRDMTATDAAILAAKLATQEDDPLLQRLGQDAGLDVGLTNVRGEKNAGLSLGKRLSPDLYVRYVVGAFEYGARLITEYRINRLFSVEVQAGQFPGGDIFYRFEGD
jgi:translocation and assembly module TamB